MEHCQIIYLNKKKRDHIYLESHKFILLYYNDDMISKCVCELTKKKK